MSNINTHESGYTIFVYSGIMTVIPTLNASFNRVEQIINKTEGIHKYEIILIKNDELDKQNLHQT